MPEWTKPSPAMTAALEVAQVEVGVRENPPGSNWGSRVSEYLASVGWAQPAPWCAAFVAWVLARADMRLGSCSDVPRSADCTRYLDAHGCRVVHGKPEHLAPGMLFLLYYPLRADVGHIGFVEGPVPHRPGYVYTIEGNTDPAGGREGIAVARRERRIAGLHAVIEY